MNRHLSQFNIEVSSTQGVSIDTTSPMAIAVYKLKLMYLNNFPDTFYIKITQNHDKEWQVVNTFTDCFSQCGEIFYNCHSTLPRPCYANFNLVSDNQMSVFLFISKEPVLPILVKGLSNKITGVQTLDGTPIAYKQSNRLHKSAGVLWINPAKAPLHDDLNIIKISLASPLKAYLGSGAPITKN